MPARELLTVDQEQRIIDAIALAESDTTGEIRVHIEFDCKGDPLKRAEKLFHKLKMDRTKRRNGVLLYIATDARKVAVYGDAGITARVEENFWQDEIDAMIREFREGNFETGIVSVISDIGEKLKTFFPGEEKNPNELKNTLSFEDNRSRDNTAAGSSGKPADVHGAGPADGDSIYPTGKKTDDPATADDQPAGGEDDPVSGDGDGPGKKPDNDTEKGGGQ